MRTSPLVIFILLLVYNSVKCGPVYLELVRPTNEELAFMKRYGYLGEVPSEDFDMAYSLHSISEAVKRLQAFAGLPQTGVLDPNTKALFKKKRCGVKDIESSSYRKRRYILQRGWKKKSITYRVSNVTRTLDKAHVEALMEAGFALWAPSAGLHFRRLEAGAADIEISFVRGDHGDGFPFDGPGQVVAHAFGPPHGAMHFDDDELWGEIGADDADDGEVTDFFATAAHEIGHALGMAHSNDKASVMYPYYQVPVERLNSDDILGMQELYMEALAEDSSEAAALDGARPTHAPAPRFTKPGSDEDDPPDLCYTNYDTVQVLYGKIYVFEEEWVWVLSDRNAIEKGYPKRFHQVFRGLPDNVTVIKTVYENWRGNTVVFSEKNYWELTRDFSLIKEGRISDYSLPSEVAGLSTVFLSNFNNKTYLIDYERYWRYDEANRTMDEKNPREMSMWRNLPYPVDAALIWRGATYFFRGPRFWRFDNELVQAHDYYPLPTAQIWFGCNPSPDIARYTTNVES